MSAPPRFRWDSSWGAEAFRPVATDQWAHHGIATTPSGFVVTMAANASEVIVLTPGGALDRRFEVDVRAAHGLTLDGDDALWIADNGQAPEQQSDGTYVARSATGDVTGAVVRYSLEGEQLMRLPMPPLAVYRDSDYSPTHVAIDSMAAGGSGDIWVADGYGQGLVHRYDKDGRYVATLSGVEGAGRFDRPHAVHVDRRHERPELYVSDRSNGRLQVFDLSGTFLRAVGDLSSPGGFAAIGDHLYVSELDARVTILDLDDNVVGSLPGSADSTRGSPGWPNRLDERGRTVRPELVDGVFSTPHGIAAGPDGSLYITEWMIGGRLVRLTPETQPVRETT